MTKIVTKSCKIYLQFFYVFYLWKIWKFLINNNFFVKILFFLRIVGRLGFQSKGWMILNLDMLENNVIFHICPLKHINHIRNAEKHTYKLTRTHRIRCKICHILILIRPHHRQMQHFMDWTFSSFICKFSWHEIFYGGTTNCTLVTYKPVICIHA